MFLSSGYQNTFFYLTIGCSYPFFLKQQYLSCVPSRFGRPRTLLSLVLAIPYKIVLSRKTFIAYQETVSLVPEAFHEPFFLPTYWFSGFWFSMTSTPPSCSAPTRNLQVATLISSSLRILAIAPDAHLFPSLIMWRCCFPFQRCGDCHLYISFQEHTTHCSIVCMLRGGPDPIIAECQLCFIQF